MRHYKYIFLSISILFSMGAYAQNTAKTLSIEAAIATTIENNFTIKLNRNNAKSASIDAVPGAAGYLPTVSANASYNYASDNTDLAFADPSQPEINANGAVTETVNAGIVVDYNIYSGGSRKYTYEKLKNTSYVSELQLKQQIEQAVLTAVSQYLNALNQREAARISEESVEISRTRFDRAGSNYAFGATSKLELLNAEVDLRNDSTNYVQAMVIATPITFFIISSWLERYAYRIDMHPWLFIIPVALVLLISLFTILTKTWQISNMNPVNSLRDE